MKSLSIYGTLGPSLHTQDVLYEVLYMGMNGVRLNLSHVDLTDCGEWLYAYQKAQEQADVQAKLLIDMKGPELWAGRLREPVLLEERQTVELGKDIPIPAKLLTHTAVQQRLPLDDGRVLSEVKQVEGGALLCTIPHGNVLKSGESLALVNDHIELPIPTESDIRNLKIARQYSVTGIMQPFVRDTQDLITMKETLKSIGNPNLQVYVKTENMEGVAYLKELFPYCDQIVTVRGDSGNTMSLWELPAIQKRIQDICRVHSMPYMVVTQMLDSMMEHPVPTRAEVNDIFHAVHHDASSIMLTGGTAVGKYPREAMKYFSKTARPALVCREEVLQADMKKEFLFHLWVGLFFRFFLCLQLHVSCIQGQ